MSKATPLHQAAAVCARIIYESEYPSRIRQWDSETPAIRGTYWERGLEVAKASFAVLSGTGEKGGEEDAR